jgi:hypothetical protein
VTSCAPSPLPGVEAAGPDAGRRGALACRPGPQASSLHSARPVKSARPGAGPGLTPRPEPRVDAGRHPARREGAGPARGPAAGRVPRRGHGGAHRDGARPRRTRARPRAASRYGLARLRAARYPDRRICHRPLPHAFRFSVPLQKSGFWGLFSLGTPKKVLVRQKSAVVAGGSFTSGDPSCRDPVKLSSGPPSCRPGCHLCSYLSSAVSGPGRTHCRCRAILRVPVILAVRLGGGDIA